MKKLIILLFLALVLFPGSAIAYDFFYPEKVFVNGSVYSPDEEISLQNGENKVAIIFDYRHKRIRPKNVRYRLSISSDVASIGKIKHGIVELSKEDDSSWRRDKKKYYCLLTLNARKPGNFYLYVKDQETGGPPEMSNFIRFLALN